MKRVKFQKHKKIIAAATCGVLILGIATGILLHPKSETNEDVIWREYPVERSDIVASLDGSGKLEFTKVEHSFSVNLKIKEIFVEVGQEVKKGDKLVEYSKEDIEAKIAECETALETAERSLQDIKNSQQAEKLQNDLANAQSKQQAQNAYESSKRECESTIQELEQKAKQLQEKISSLQQELEQAEEEGGEDVQALQAELEQLQAELANLEASGQTVAEETVTSETALQTEETTPSETKTQEEDSAAAIQAKKEQIAQLQARIDAASAAADRIASLKEQISQFQSELAATKKQLDDQKTALENLNADYERQTAQNKDNQGIQNQINSLNNAGKENAVKNAQAEVDKAKKDLSDVQSLLETPVLTAETGGIVSAINYLPGEEVPANRTIVVVGNNQKKQVIISVLQEDIASVEVGQSVELRFSSAPENAVDGKVIKKSLLPKDGGDGVSYEVIISLNEDDPELLEGMTCSVKFILKKVENVLTLANKAITLRDGKQYVTVKLPDGSHEEREIRTGFSDGRISEITDGLSDGDIVVVAG